MCGLVGIVCDRITADHKKVFRLMLKLDEIRGQHSTGIGMVNKEGNFGWCKKEGTCENLYEEYASAKKDSILEHDGDVRGWDWKYLMGHNRHATKGAVDDRNAHPFAFENIIGAHNGTLQMHTMKNFEGFKGEDLDSRLFYSEIEHRGGEVKDIYSEVGGAMALTWYDKKDKTVRILRNNQRTLFFCWSYDQKTMFYASEPWMIQAAQQRVPEAFRSNINKENYKGKIRAFKPDHLYSVSIDEVHEDNLKLVELEPRSVPTQNMWYQNQSSPAKKVGEKKNTQAPAEYYKGAEIPFSKWNICFRKDNGKEITFLSVKRERMLPNYEEFMKHPELEFARVEKGKTLWYPSKQAKGWVRYNYGWTDSIRQSIQYDQESEEKEKSEKPEEEKEDEEKDSSEEIVVTTSGEQVSVEAAQSMLNKMTCLNCATKGSDFNLKNPEDRKSIYFVDENLASALGGGSHFCCDWGCVLEVEAVARDFGRDFEAPINPYTVKENAWK